MGQYEMLEHNGVKYTPGFRQFLGQEPIKPSVDAKPEEKLAYRQALSFYGKHLHAYLMGYERFTYKTDEFGQPKYYNVEQKYIKNESKEETSSN